MTKTIRSLERGLQVLKALDAAPISSLQEIHQQTRISKPTLLRILLTLEQSGLVSRRLPTDAIALARVWHASAASVTVMIVSQKRPPRCSIDCARKYRGRPISWCQPATIWRSGRQAARTVRL